MKELVEFLADVELFRDFSPRELGEIAAICKPVSFREGEVIVEEGVRGRDLFIIRQGRVGITLSKSPGRYDLGTITTCEPGQVFGELAFIDGARRSTSVIALEDGEAVKISWGDFGRLVQVNLGIGYQFYRNVALLITERLRDTTMFCSNLLGMR